MGGTSARLLPVLSLNGSTDEETVDFRTLALLLSGSLRAAVSKGKSRAVGFACCIRYRGRTLKPQFRLRGLDPVRALPAQRAEVVKSRFWGHGKTLGGDFLIEKRINPDLCKLCDSGVFYLEAR